MMRRGTQRRGVGAMCLLVAVSCQGKQVMSVTVPVKMDHNRMLVDAEMRGEEGNWHGACLWVDTGNPDFFISEAYARQLGVDLSEAKDGTVEGKLEISPPTGVRIGGFPVDLGGVRSYVVYEPAWLFTTMHNDANLPSTVLKKYHVVFDYPGQTLTLAAPGSMVPRGIRVPVSVHPVTGIVQIDAVIGGDSLSLAVDNGASYSFSSAELVSRCSAQHPDWPRSVGATGCANIWGWWPEEDVWPLLRLREVRCESVQFTDVGIVGLPMTFPLTTWYSRKTARPVDGLLGPNALKPFRIEIDYTTSSAYFERRADPDPHDMDLVGLTLRPVTDGSYVVLGAATKDGVAVVAGVEPGDTLLQVGDLVATGATMGAVMDALRGSPGEPRTLALGREGGRCKIDARVARLL